MTRDGTVLCRPEVFAETPDPLYVAAMKPMTPEFFVHIWARFADNLAIMRAAVSFFAGR